MITIDGDTDVKIMNDCCCNPECTRNYGSGLVTLLHWHARSYGTVIPPRKSLSCDESHFSWNGVRCGYVMARMESWWQLRGLHGCYRVYLVVTGSTPRSFPPAKIALGGSYGVALCAGMATVLRQYKCPGGGACLIGACTSSASIKTRKKGIFFPTRCVTRVSR